MSVNYDNELKTISGPPPMTEFPGSAYVNMPNGVSRTLHLQP